MTSPTFGRADLTNCDREPIHIPGSIQPHGVLLAATLETGVITHVGGRTIDFLGLPSARILGSTLNQLLGEIVSRQLEPPPGPARTGRSIAAELAIEGRKYTVTGHRQGGQIIVEILEQLPGQRIDVLETVHSMIGLIGGTDDLQTLLQALADQVQSFSGFDRVMIYRFREDDSGHVVAEQRSDRSVPSFLDLHYPASDIPQQARQLYLNNLIRYIPECGYTPQPIVSAPDLASGPPLDLSYSTLRSVSPLHLEYLANMEVQTSLSLSLIVRSKLWGLIACHHRASLALDPRVQLGLELFAQLGSLKLQSTVELGEANDRVRKRDIHNLLSREIGRVGLAEALMASRPNLLEYIAAGGVAVHTAGDNAVLGTTPSDDQINRLAEWLNENQPEGVFATDHLAAVLPAGVKFGAEAAGLLALSVSRQPRDYVLWFLPELTSTVTWAGNPEKPVERGDGERPTSAQVLRGVAGDRFR